MTEVRSLEAERLADALIGTMALALLNGKPWSGRYRLDPEHEALCAKWRDLQRAAQ